MKLCFAGAKIFSTCAKRQYFCILTDDNNIIVGTGYNGGASGELHCNRGGCKRYLEGSPAGSNYDNCISVHAEANAFLHGDIQRATKLYVNGTPCYSCAKLIANTNLKEVIYIQDYSYTQLDLALDLFKRRGITARYIELEEYASSEN